MILCKLGIITDEVSPNIEVALDWALDNGLKHVEIRTVASKNVIDLSDAELAWIRNEVERRGLFVSCVASPVFKCALSPNRAVLQGDTFSVAEAGVEAHFGKLERAIEIAAMLGTRNIRIFSFWREQHPERYKGDIEQHLKRAAWMADGSKALLLLENEPSCNGGYASEVADLVRAVNSSSLRALWDPGNEVYGQRSAFPEGYHAIQDVVHHVHLKDARINDNGEPECVPIGEGSVPFILQLKALQKNGYSGLYTIETHYAPEGGSIKDGSQISLSGLQRLVLVLDGC